MKPKVIGLLIVLALIAGGTIYALYTNNQPDPIVLNGYLGGEKVGFLEDEQVKEVLKKKHSMTIQYAKAGSLDMVRANQENRNYLFPSSQTALELYQNTIGQPKQSEIIFNTPIVLYSHKMVADAFIKAGLVTEQDGVYMIDMQKLVAILLEGKTWADLGLPQLYGSVSVNTTDPTKSNSGNMFAGLLANALNGGKVVDMQTVDAILPDLRLIFQKLGYMETSSADIFDQFLKTGVGAKPVVAGYESQLLEFGLLKPDQWARIKDDIVIFYPTPTVWSSHIFIALDDEGKKGITALLDPEVQKLAWERHGFRTGVYTAENTAELFGVEGVAKTVTQIIPMPNAAAMEKIIESLQP